MMKQAIINVCCFCGLVCCFLTTLVNADVLAIDGENNTEAFKDYEISSAVPVPTDGIEGRIIEANPPDACSNISHPPYSNSSIQWFVLISGDACNLNVKIYFAQVAGFSAAVIYKVNPKESNGYKHTSHHLLPHPNISAVWIMEHSGLQIKAKYLYTFDDRSRIIIFPNHSFNLITFLLLFAIVAGTCVIMMLLFAVIKCIQQSRQRRHNRLSSRHLKQLPTSKYKKGDPYDVCAICLEDYNEGDKLRILPCSHAYHTKCIDPWLTNNRRTCPVCKRKVILIGVHSDCDSDSDTDSRAETTPLLRPTYRRNQQGGGTFSNGHHNPLDSSSDRAIREGSGESTSRDAASAAFDESSDDNSQPHQSSPTIRSSHYLEVCPESNQSSSQILAVPCNSVNSVSEIAQSVEEDHLIDIDGSTDHDGLIANVNVNRNSGYKNRNNRPLVV